MLDTRTVTPGILLAGRHETQFTGKALNGMDPWTVGVTAVIKENIRRKRGVPTYSLLYTEAKSYIRAQLADRRLSLDYKGRSRNESKPIPGDQGTKRSNQDPQLAFYSGYMDPGEERFLFPFEAPSGGGKGGDVTKYPVDEYPHEKL